jgi:hypothetical protein
MTATQQLTSQHMEALAYANSIRLARAEDKRKIERGQLSVPAILHDVPLHWESAKIIDLLLSMKRCGRVKALNWLRVEKVSEGRRLRDLTERERFALARHVDVWQIIRRDDLRRQMDATR